jgi:hypothetical protein
MLGHAYLYEGVSKIFRTGRLERELQMLQLSATRFNCIAILWVSLVSFAAITLCVASQRVFIVVVVYFVIDSVRKLLDTHSYEVVNIYIKYSLNLTNIWSYNRWFSRLWSNETRLNLGLFWNCFNFKIIINVTRIWIPYNMSRNRRTKYELFGSE